jgi:hypothetical protein
VMPSSGIVRGRNVKAQEDGRPTRPARIKRGRTPRIAAFT